MSVCWVIKSKNEEVKVLILWAKIADLPAKKSKKCEKMYFFASALDKTFVPVKTKPCTLHSPRKDHLPVCRQSSVDDILSQTDYTTFKLYTMNCKFSLFSLQAFLSRILVVVFFFLFAPLNLSAQPDLCIEFDQMTLGVYGPDTGFMAGDTLYGEGGVWMSLELLVNPNGTAGPLGQLVATDQPLPIPFPGLNGTYIAAFNAAMGFDFSHLPQTVYGVAIPYYDAGGYENISVNGDTVWVANSPDDFPVDVAFGVELQVEHPANAPEGTGIIVLTGEIESVQIGGQEFFFDYVCLQYGWPCLITEVEAEPFSCDEEGSYELLVNFEHIGAGTDSFWVHVYNESFGPFLYDDLPVTIGPLPGIGALPVYVEVTDAANPNCSGHTVIDPVDCSDVCVGFEDIEQGTVWGSTAGNSPGDVVYEAEGVVMSVHGFLLPAGQNVFGNVLFDQAPAAAPPHPIEHIAGLTSNINLGFDFSFLEDSVFALRIGFANLGGINNISVNGGDLIVFENFADLPSLLPGMAQVVMLPDTTNNEVGYLFLYGGASPIQELIIGGQELALDNLCLYLANEMPACSISDLKIEQLPCLAGGQFFVELSFAYENTGNFGFTVVGNGVNYGTFSYDDLPLLLGPLSVDGSIFYEFAVQDVEFPDCGDFVDFGMVQCSDQCVEMEELAVGTIYGAGSGMMPGDVAFVEDDVTVTLDSFQYFDSTYAFLNATIEDGVFGPPDNPLTGNYVFVSNINMIFDFTGLTEPVTTVSFGFVDGGGMENFSINGGELFTLNNLFELPLQSIPGFDVQVLPAPAASNVSGYVIITGPVETLLIGGQELALDNICFVTEPPCSITDLEAGFLEVVDDGLLYVVNFEAGNTGQDYFDLYLDGEFLGYFPVSDLPLEVVLPCGDLPEGEVTVCMSDVPDCCASVTVDMSPCLPCNIHDLEVEPNDCDATGFFTLNVNFEHQGAGTSFKIKAAGEFFGPFDYADLPVTIGPFLGDGVTTYPILIRDTQDPACKLVGSFGPVDCEIGCVLHEVELELIGQDVGELAYWLDLTAVNPASDHFVVHFEGAFVGSYAYADLPVEVLLPCVNLPEGELVICDSDTTANCCVTVPVDMTPCLECHIGELIVEPHECQDGTFYFDLDFPHQNGSADGFKVAVNGQNMGVYSYADLPLTLGPLDGDGTTVYHLVVRDLSDPYCIRTADFGPVDCEQPCAGPSLYAEVIGEGDEGILVEIGQSGPGLIEGSLDVYANGIFIGTFDELPANPMIITLPCGFPGPVFLTVCYHDVPDCCVELTLVLPDCLDCHIFNVEAVHTPCDIEGLFFVHLNFDYVNVGDQFKVVGNGVNYGLFNYSELPVTLGPFVGDGSTVYEFVVSDVADPACSNYTEIGPVDCATECSIFDLTATPGDCAADGTYSLTVDFAYQNAPNDHFDLWLDGELFGTYLLSELPLTIDSLEPGVVSLVHLLVCINDSNCCEDTNYEAPSCVVFDEIWPGDANRNGEANYDDLLFIGLAYGTTGPQRDEQGINWQAYTGPNWPQFFADTVLNYKFADCNGDGVIDAEDLDAIEQNYGLSYTEPTPVPVQEATQSDPPIYLSLPADLPNGQPFTAEVIVGTEAIPVEALYGLSFKIKFDPQVIIASSVDVSFENSWLAAGGEIISIDRTLVNDGLVEVAVSRIDQTDVGGFGAMAEFVGIIDDVLGKGEVQVHIVDVRALRADEVPVPLYKLPALGDISTSVQTPVAAEGIRLFPNPVSDWLYFHLPKGVHIERVWVYDAQGKRQWLSLDGQKLNMSRLAAGMYYLKIETTAGEVIYRKVLK